MLLILNIIKKYNINKNEKKTLFKNNSKFIFLNLLINIRIFFIYLI